MKYNSHDQKKNANKAIKMLFLNEFNKQILTYP